MSLSDSQPPFRPGFWCCAFWGLTWLGIFGGLAAFWCLPPEVAGTYAAVLWGAAVPVAVISTIIRTVTKNRHDGTKSWHWFD